MLSLKLVKVVATLRYVGWLTTLQNWKALIEFEPTPYCAVNLTFTFDMSNQNHITCSPKVMPYTEFEHFGIIRLFSSYAPDISVNPNRNLAL